MRNRIALLGLLLLTSCGRGSSGPYPLVGAFKDYNETFKGAVRVNFSTATSYLTVDTTNSKIHCEGLSRVTDRSALGLLRACSGYRGFAVLQCNDGRHLNADWTASTCTSGAGEGTDDNGTVFGFNFGMSQPEADDDLARLKTGVAQKPALPGYREAQRKGGTGSGTGFLISKDGLVATNFHVVDGATSIEIYQAGKTYSATVIAKDAANDLAILKTEMQGQPLVLGSARTIERGADVMTLGFPLPDLQGRNQKATFGRVNALTGINDDGRFLQIDIPIQPGNSGGPLISKRGEVIGVVSSSLSQVRAFMVSGNLAQNVNYAIKADYIAAMLPSGTKTETELPRTDDFAAIVRASENSVFMIEVKF